MIFLRKLHRMLKIQYKCFNIKNSDFKIKIMLNTTFKNVFKVSDNVTSIK